MKTVIFGLFTMVFILMSCNNKGEETPSKLTSAIDQTFPKGAIIDLTHEFSEEAVYWVTAKEFKLDTVFNGETDQGFYYSVNNFETAEHGGTHIDAPIHFSKDRQTVAEIPLEKLIGPAIKINVSAKAMNNPDYQITINDFIHWETTENMKIPDGSIILLQTGFSRYYPDKLSYLGTEQRGEDAVKLLHFPGLSHEASEWLVTNRKINAIGIDTASIDYGQSQEFGSHINLMSENIPAFENLTNLDKLPTKGFNIIALPMKIKGGSGAPLRIVALLK